MNFDIPNFILNYSKLLKDILFNDEIDFLFEMSVKSHTGSKLSNCLIDTAQFNLQLLKSFQNIFVGLSVQ